MLVITGFEPLLPIDSEVRKIALLGKLAKTRSTGDGGSSMVRPPEVVTPLEGFRQYFPDLGPGRRGRWLHPHR